MSMTAAFIQIDPDEAARIQRDPSLAEALFEDPREATANLAAMSKMSEAMQQRVRTAGPQMLAQALERFDPRIRESLEQRLGQSMASFAGGQGGGALLKLMQERQARAAGHMSMAANAARARLSLEKEWHGIHYLLCGKSEPDPTALGQAVLGGTDLGDDDEGFSGYGPARLINAGQVKKISEALQSSSLEADAGARFDPAAMKKLDLYPGFRESDREALLEGLRRLRNFYGEAAGAGRAIVTCIL